MTHFDPQDPRLTAFALGELTGDERAEFETHVASCAECAKLIDELKQLGELVTAGLRQDGAVPEKLTQLPLQVASKEPARRWNRRRVFAYATAASLAGVIVGVMVTQRQPDLTVHVAAQNGESGETNHGNADVNQIEKTSLRIPKEVVKSTSSKFLDSRVEVPAKKANAMNGDAVKGAVESSKGPVREYLVNDSAGSKGRGQASNEPVPPPMSVAPTVGQSLHFKSAPLPASSAMPTGATAAPSPNATPRNNADYSDYSFRPRAANAPNPSPEAKVRMLENANRAIPVTSGVPMNKAIEEVEAERAAMLREGRNPATHNFNTESYARIHDNPFLDSKTNPLSTFSIDVDTGSYSNVRRFLTGNQLPPPDAVRIEELLNYFSYDYAPPTGEHPFAAHVEVASAPWMPAHRLVRVGIKGKVVTREQRPAANLVFLIDVSGSMSSDNKLPLVKKALKLLVDQLDEKDRVSMVVYAGASGLVLDTTPAYQKEAILTAIDRLQSGGSTNGGAGIQLAYAKATAAFIKEGVNRVILATDGDFNVGVTNQGELTRLIEKEAKSGVFLSVLGFGMGNLKDATLEQLADKGNGTYGYIDTLAEARKVFVEQVNGTLVTIAKDVKIQIEFNPAQVASYRLIGYENRLLRKEDFNDDTKDAGEIGAGHTVTALYEVVPVGVNTRPGNSAAPAVDPLKYQTPAATPMPAVKLPDASSALDELLTLKLRYKQPDGDKSTLIETPAKDSKTSFEQASSDLRFAASVAAFGMRLRGSEHAGDISWPQIIEFARRATGEDANGYRHEFVTLVEQAAKLSKR
jgi:Ca-activated chloride channel family protein